MSSAVAVVREALVAALTADAALMALLGVSGAYGGVYDEIAPEGAPYDFIVISSTAEDEAAALGHEGKAGIEFVNIRTRPATKEERPGSRRAKRIYVEVERILNGRALPLAGRGMYLGRTRLVTTFLEPDNKTTSAPVEYTFRTMEPLNG